MASPDLAQAARIIREATKDKSYQETPLGQEVAAYLRQKRKRLTDSSYRNYEGILHKLVIDHADLELPAFEPPAGSDLVETFMDRRYGDGSERAYNRNLSIVADFLKWARIKGKLHGDPMLGIERAKPRDVYRTTFTADQRTAIIASTADRRDRLALRLLLDYGLRKGALQSIQFKHFDHQRRRLTIFTKGRKVRELPIPQTDFWQDLERLILDWEVQPHHYFMCLVKPIPRAGARRFPDRMMSSTALHRWWYRQLEAAGQVARGTTSGERMHKARHTAGQRVLDRTGNLKAAQKLLGHASIATTADIYTDWDIDQLAQTMADVVENVPIVETENPC